MATNATQIPLNIDYDAEADALYVSYGEARPSEGKSIGNGFIVRYPLNDPREPLGVIVQRFKANGWASKMVKLAGVIADILPIEQEQILAGTRAYRARNRLSITRAA